MDAFVAMQHPEHGAVLCFMDCQAQYYGGAKRPPEKCSEGVQSQPTSISGRRSADNRMQQRYQTGSSRSHSWLHTFQSGPSKDCKFCISQVGPTQTDAAEGMDERPVGQEEWLKVTKHRLKSRIAWMIVTGSSWTVEEAIKK